MQLKYSELNQIPITCPFQCIGARDLGHVTFVGIKLQYPMHYYAILVRCQLLDINKVTSVSQSGVLNFIKSEMYTDIIMLYWRWLYLRRKSILDGYKI